MKDQISSKHKACVAMSSHWLKHAVNGHASPCGFLHVVDLENRWILIWRIASATKYYHVRTHESYHMLVPTDWTVV